VVLDQKSPRPLDKNNIIILERQACPIQIRPMAAIDRNDYIGNTTSTPIFDLQLSRKQSRTALMQLLHLTWRLTVY
jgi:hypothetical protein